jgi:lactate dehydrogenase-like 2-hydroxyacid dehydrogenase
MKPDVLLVWPNRPRQMAMLEETYDLHRHDLAKDPEALIREVGPRVTAVATTGGKGLRRDLIEKLPNLKLVASSGVGYDTIDIAACNERGIVVTNTPDVLTDDVADLGLALILAIQRALILGDRWVREGRWKREGMMPLTTAIRGKRLGIVGLGRIGKAVALRALPLGMEISYFGRSRQATVPYRFYDDLRAMCRDIDILLLSCAGGEATRNLVNADVLEALGPKGVLINISRGTVVDEPALIEALKSGGIAGAGLDVFANEPDPDGALIAMDNVVLYPHHASGTTETRDAMAQLVVDNLAAFFAGKPLLTPVNLPPGD